MSFNLALPFSFRSPRCETLVPDSKALESFRIMVGKSDESENECLKNSMGIPVREMLPEVKATLLSMNV